MKHNGVSRFISFSLSVLLFLTNSVFAHSAESTVWAERKNQREKTTRVAGLPLAFQDRSLPLNSSSLLAPSRANAFSSGLTGETKTVVDVLTRNIPASVGNIRKISLPKQTVPRGWVFYIQDIHLNEDAQANISKSIQAMLSQQSVGVFALEGAFTKIDLSEFKTFPHQPFVHHAADALLKEKRIQGPLHGALCSTRSSTVIQGIDSQSHYEANVAAYRASTGVAQQLKEKWQAKNRDILKKKLVFNPALRAFDAMVEAHRQGNSSLADYVEALGSDGSLDITAFHEALRLEKTLDFSRVEQERVQLIKGLTQKMTESESSSLLKDSFAYRSGMMSHVDFYGRLRELTQSKGLDLKKFPAMNAYLQYVLLSDSINIETVLGDLKKQEDKNYRRLTKTAEEKSLLDESERLSLTLKLLNFELTRVEWDAYKTSSHPSAAEFSPFETFYREAEARDDAMATNLLQSLRSTASDKALLVTGGFHSTGIIKKLNATGMGVVMFVPTIKKVELENSAAYLSVFAQQKTPLDELFSGEKLFLPQPVLTNKTRGLLALLTDASARWARSAIPPLLTGWTEWVDSAHGFVGFINPGGMQAHVGFNAGAIGQIALVHAPDTHLFSTFPSSIGSKRWGRNCSLVSSRSW